MDKLGSSFRPWEDSTHVLTQMNNSDSQGQHIDFWVRCDVTTAVCERAPIQESNGTTDVIDW